jgi:hypothetical protein
MTGTVQVLQPRTPFKLKQQEDNLLCPSLLSSYIYILYISFSDFPFPLPPSSPLTSNYSTSFPFYCISFLSYPSTPLLPFLSASPSLPTPSPHIIPSPLPSFYLNVLIRTIVCSASACSTFFTGYFTSPDINTYSVQREDNS